MNENQAGSAKPFDPFEPFRGVRDAYRDSMSKTMIDAVNSEDYAQTTGAMLDVYLTASALFREALEKSMVQALQNLSMPSRQELAALAERFTSLEMRLYEMDAKLDTLGNLLLATSQMTTPAQRKSSAASAATRTASHATGAAPRSKKRSVSPSKSSRKASASKTQR
jgi:hypothetical protein